MKASEAKIEALKRVPTSKGLDDAINEINVAVMNGYFSTVAHGYTLKTYKDVEKSLLELGYKTKSRIYGAHSQVEFSISWENTNE